MVSFRQGDVLVSLVQSFTGGWTQAISLRQAIMYD